MILKTDQLITGCIQQNRADQKLLYKMMYSLAPGLCLRYTGNAKDSSEVMNTGFMKIFTDLYQHKEPFKDWLSRIMINVCIDHYKNTPLTDHSKTVQDTTDYVLPDHKLTKDEMMQMVQQLPPAPRMVFNLIAIDGYVHNEVAGLLGINILTVNSHLVEARLQLKRMITLKKLSLYPLHFLPRSFHHVYL